MVSASQQLIDLGSERGGSAVLAQRGEVGGDLAVEQSQLLQFAAGESVRLGGGGDECGQPFPVRGALLNPAVGKDSHGGTRFRTRVGSA